MGAKSRVIAVALGLLIGIGIMAAGQAWADTPGSTVAVDMNVGKDGTLAVTETITPAKGTVLHRNMPLDVPVEGNRIQHFTVDNVTTTGDVSAAVEDKALTITARGQASVKYTVRGTVADVDDHQQFTWPFATGWDADLRDVTGTFASPSIKASSPECSLGAPGAQTRCTAAMVDHTGPIVVKQDMLPAGSVTSFTVVLPAGTVSPSAEFSLITGPPGPFALTGPSIAALGAVGAVGLLTAGWALSTRRKDAGAALTAVPSTDPLLRDATGTRFAAPDGVLPGQVGTVVDHRVDPVDLTATVIDLAVRGYLWIAETTGPTGHLDWQISRRSPADDHLATYESELLTALLPDDAHTVFTSALQPGGTQLGLDQVPAALYADAQAHGWFRRSPDQLDALTRYGIGIFIAGIAVAATLAATVGHALIGVALSGLGAVLALTGVMLPVRTARGRLLVAHIAALRRYLHGLSLDGIDPEDQEIVIERTAPYAVVLGELDVWLTVAGSVDLSADGAPGFDWYSTNSGTDTTETELTGFVANFPALVNTLNGIVARSAHLSILPQR